VFIVLDEIKILLIVTSLILSGFLSLVRFTEKQYLSNEELHLILVLLSVLNVFGVWDESVLELVGHEDKFL